MEQLLTPSRSWRRPLHVEFVLRIDPAAADLAAGVKIGAVGDRAVVLGDAEHVRGVVEPGVVGEGGGIGHIGRPDAVFAAMHRNGCRHPAAVVPDVAASHLAAHQLDIAGVGRPHGKADRRRLLHAVRVKLVGAEPPAVGEVVADGLVGAAEREAAVAIGGGRVADLGRDAPDVRVLGRRHRDAPAEGLANLAVVELHCRAKGGTPVVRRECLHLRGRPLVGAHALPVPASRQPGTEKDGTAQACPVFEIHGYRRHRFPPALRLPAGRPTSARFQSCRRPRELRRQRLADRSVDGLPVLGEQSILRQVSRTGAQLAEPGVRN